MRYHCATGPLYVLLREQHKPGAATARMETPYANRFLRFQLSQKAVGIWLPSLLLQRTNAVRCSHLCPHEELNLDLGLRSPWFYPLNYGDKKQLLVFCRAL